MEENKITQPKELQKGLKIETTIEKTENKTTQQTEQTQQIQPRLEVQPETLTQRSKADWLKYLKLGFAGSGYSYEQRMPDELPEEDLTEKTKYFAGRHVGIMEMGKARKEYKAKKTQVEKVRAIAASYQEHINDEERAIYRKELAQFRDFWPVTKLLDSRQDKQDLLDAKLGVLKPQTLLRTKEEMAEGKEAAKKEVDPEQMELLKEKNDEKLVATLTKAYQEVLTADLSIFAYNDESEIFENYEEKLRLTNAGATMRTTLQDFKKAGGRMDEADLNELNARIDFLEQQNQLFILTERIMLNPCYLLLRDKDLKGMSMEQVNAKQKKLHALIDKKAKAGQNTERLQNLETFMKDLSMLKDRQKMSLQPGDDPIAYYQKLLGAQQKKSVDKWTKNLKTYKKEMEKQADLTKLLYPEKEKIKVEKGAWTGNGLDDREETHTSIVELIYLQEHQTDISELDKKESQKDLLKIRNFVEEKLHTQKGKTDGKDAPEDVETMTRFMVQMIRGFILQFSPHGTTAFYKQFIGIEDPKTMKWGEKAALLRRLGRWSQDIFQLCGANQEVAKQAFMLLSPKEIELYRKAMYFAGGVSYLLQILDFTMIGAKMEKSDGVSEDNVAKLLTADEENMNAKKFQFITRYLSSLSKDMDKLSKGACHMEMVNGVKTTVPRPFVFTGGMGEVSDLIKYVPLSRKESYEKMDSEEVQQKHKDELKAQLQSNTIAFHEFVLVLDEKGTVKDVKKREDKYGEQA